MILITGNAGFIGKYLTDALLKIGYDIQGIDINPRKDTEKGFEQIEGNILDKETVRQSMARTDCIIHLAAEHKDFGITEAQYHRVNVDGTQVLLDVADELHIKKFIFYSSVAVYGAQSSTTEQTKPLPNNFYGASKYAAEKEIIEWAEKDKSKTVIIIRPTVVFGPNSKANIFRLIRQLCDNKFMMIGDGTNIKSIAYVENLVDATLYLMANCAKGSHIYNYADEPHMQTKEMVKLIGLLAGKKPPKFYIPLQLAILGGVGFDVLGKITGIDFPITTARMKKFTMSTYHRAEKIRDLGFVPRFTIEEGLKKNIEWYQHGKMFIGKEMDSIE